MRYFLDAHSLSNKLLNPSTKRDDLYVLEEVMDEYAFSDAEVQKAGRAGIQTLRLERRHLQKMQEFMAKHGDNFKLIRLFTAEGIGDVAMLAYVLAERDTPETLFPESYTLVTQDKELTKLAGNYGIPCLAAL